MQAKPYVASLAAILIVQGFDTFALDSAESGAEASFLQRLPREMQGGSLTRQLGLDIDAQNALKPDDYLARYYARASDHRAAELVIAYFRSQREGFGPHSPQVCLPAAGWTPVLRTMRAIKASEGLPVAVNHFVIRRHGKDSTVLYWYQTPRTSSTGEIHARLLLAWDTLFLRRSDISLVRITVPMAGADDGQAVEAAAEMAQQVHRELRRVWQ